MSASKNFSKYPHLLRTSSLADAKPFSCLQKKNGVHKLRQSAFELPIQTAIKQSRLYFAPQGSIGLFVLTSYSTGIGPIITIVFTVAEESTHQKWMNTGSKIVLSLGFKIPRQANRLEAVFNSSVMLNCCKFNPVF